MARTAAVEIWQVGDLRLDVGQARVTRGATEIALPRLSFDLLLALARGAPNIVSADQLIAEVWVGLVVSPETVVQRVKLLREALATGADDSHYVVTVRSRGYKLAVPAKRIEPQATSVMPSLPATPAPEPGPSRAAPPERSWRRPPLVAAALLAMLLIAVALFWLPRAPSPGATTTGARDQAVAPEIAVDRTVAVLPFRNLSTDPADAVIAQGLPEMLLARLATVSGITVIARDSSFRFAQKGMDPREMGRLLNAGYLVEGSVQRNGDSLRVTAQLVDARGATQLWSARFDRDIAQLYSLQDEIGEQVALTLESRIAGLTPLRPSQDRSANVEAYLAYLRGRALVARYTVSGAEAAAVQFERATQLDPQFAAAYAALFDARMQAAGLRHGDLDAVRARNRPALQRALELDPSSAIAHYARAMWEDIDNEAREAAFRRAMLLDPSNARGLVAFSEFLDITDGTSPASRVAGSGFDPSSRQAAGPPPARASPARAEEAGRILARVLWMDPLSPRARFRESMRRFRAGAGSPEPSNMALLELDPDYYPALQRAAKYRSINHGKPAEAVALIERAIRVDPENPWAPHTAVAFYLDADDRAGGEAVAALTPVSRQTAAVLLAQHGGDRRRAGELALGPRAFEFGFNESWGVAEALRDYALLTRDTGRSEELLRTRYGLPANEPWTLDVANFRSAVPLAHVWLVRGDSGRARELLRAVVDWTAGDTRFGRVYKRRTRAQALMLLGDTDLALRELEASFLEDRDFTQWWYTLDHDPVWDGVRADARFLAMAQAVRLFGRRERELLETMRQRGDVPVRGPSSATGG